MAELDRGTRIGRFVRWDTVAGALLVVVLAGSIGGFTGFGNAGNLAFLVGNTLPIAVIGGVLASMVLSLVVTPAVHYFLTREG